MHEHEIFKLPDGSDVGTGLHAGTQEEENLVASLPVFDEGNFLEDKDIERLLKGDYYLQLRTKRRPWVLNQGSLGSCNAAATVGAFHNRRAMEGLKHVPLSINYCYMHINGGRDQGSALSAGIAFAQKGMAPRVIEYNGERYDFPLTAYNTRQVPAQWLQRATQAAQEFQSFEAFKIPVNNYDTFKRAVASALARDFQIIHAWHVGNASMSLRNGYIIHGRGVGNHATLAHSAKWVGGSDLVHPDTQNSWAGGMNTDPNYGTPRSGGWGEGGYGLNTMQDFYACARNHTFWVYTGSLKNKDSLL